MGLIVKMTMTIFAMFHLYSKRDLDLTLDTVSTHLCLKMVTLKLRMYLSFQSIQIVIWKEQQINNVNSIAT